MRNKKIIIFSVFLVLALLLVYWMFFKREHSWWSDEIRLMNGSFIEVDYHYSNKIYHGGHALGWGGGDPWLEIRFEDNDDKIEWEGPYIPILLEVYNDFRYLVVFDRINKCKFRFYKYDNSWKEINYKEFPKNIALQNMWLFLAATSHACALVSLTNDFSSHDVGLDSVEFERSLNAKLWYYLETGKYKKCNPDLEFKKKFYDRYLNAK